MDSITVSAKTVEDALTEASIQLGTSRDNIEYTVIDEGSKGLFFGIGGRNATIEAKKKVTDEDLMKEIFEEKPQKPKKESKKEERREGKKESRQEKKESKEPKKETKKEPRKEPKKEIKKEAAKETVKETAKEAGKESSVKEASSESVASAAAPAENKKEYKKESRRESDRGDSWKNEKSRRTSDSRNAEGEIPDQEETKGGSSERLEDGQKGYDRKNRGRREYDHRDRKRPAYGSKDSNYRENGYRESDKDMTEKAASVLAADEALQEKEETRPRIPRTPADPEEAKSRAIAFLKEVLHTMGMEVEVKAEFEDDILCVDIEGEDMGVMIGKRGQTLDSLQYLTSLVVNKGKESYVRVKLDTEDYRNRRKATLENLAKNIAYKVKKTRRPVFLEPMNPYERRIIHSALQNDPYVTTHSEGEEPYRKVVVTLKRDRDYRGSGSGYSRYNNNRRGRYNRDYSDIDRTQSEFAEAENTSDQDEE